MALNYQKRLQATQQRAEYGASSNPVYIGQAARGVATSSTGWTINKLTYDATHNLTSFQTATGSWDDRAALTYQ